MGSRSVAKTSSGKMGKVVGSGTPGSSPKGKAEANDMWIEAISELEKRMKSIEKERLQWQTNSEAALREATERIVKQENIERERCERQEIRETELAEMTTELKSVKQEVEYLKGEKDKAQVEIEKFKIEIKTLIKEKDEIVHCLMERIEKLEEERKEHSSRWTALVMEMSQTRELVEQLGRDSSILEKETRELEGKVERLEWAVDVPEAKATTRSSNGSRDKEDRKLYSSAVVEDKKLTRLPQDERIIVVGDSMARGVGKKLKFQHGGEVYAQGGARIEEVGSQIENMKLSGDENLVVMAGGNNIEVHGTEEIMKKYRAVMDLIKEKRMKKVTVVGLFARRYFGGYLNSKVLSLNERLKNLCKERGLTYLEVDVHRNGWWLIGQDGVHFSREGEDEVAARIYKHIGTYLNGKTGSKVASK
jgi:DNA repair exonuclease SbcCD ATPase subunit